MAKTENSSGINSRQQALPIALCQLESSEPVLNGSSDATSPCYYLTPQSPKASSDQGGEDCDRSVDDGSEKQLPGIGYVFRNAQRTVLAPSVIQVQTPRNVPISDSSNHHSGQSYPLSPSTSGSCASTSETRNYHRELMDCSYLEITNHSAAGSPLISYSEDSGRPWAVSYVGSRDISNEGLCHIYDDGTYLPAYVNGAWVNPELGLTKNGNPRKRLGRACKSCNSKKVKCEPGYLKCRQCEKAQIECIYPLMSSPMGNRTKPKSSSGSPRRVPHHKSSKKSQGKTNSIDFARTRTAGDRAVGECYSEAHSSQALTKRTKIEMKASIASSSRAKMNHSWLPSDHISSKGLLITGPQPSAWAAFSWERDPINVDERLTIRLLEFVFAHINLITYSIFPYEAFMRWVKTCERKTMDDKMLLYSFMMLGCIFIPEEGHSRYTEDILFNIVKQAIEKQHDKLTIQLIQSRLLNSFYFFARGKLWEAYEHRGLAIRAIGALEMNTENGLCYFGRDYSSYGFDEARARECWRQTFWCSFLMDVSLLVNISFSYCSTHQQLSALSGRTLCTIQPEDIFLRLPLENEGYEKALSSSAPFLQEVIGSRTQGGFSSEKQMSSKAHLIHLSCIWTDVLNNMHRFVHRSNPGYYTAYETFYEHILSRLAFWRNSVSTNATSDRSSSDADTFTKYPEASKHWNYFFHTILMVLQRHVRHAVLSLAHIRRNIVACRRHARLLLLQVCVDKDTKGKGRDELDPGYGHSNMVYRRGSSRKNDQNSILGFPFAGYSIVLASDIISAGGFLGADLSETIMLLERGVGLLSRMANYWASAAMQCDILKERIRLLHLIDSNSIESKAFTLKGHFWKVKSAMATTFQPVDDICYGLVQEDFFSAIKLDE